MNLPASNNAASLPTPSVPPCLCVRPSSVQSRRSFLSNLGLGCGGLALGSLLFQDGIARANDSAEKWSPPDGQPHHTPKAKNVIWIFLSGGVSQLETFDPKEALNKHAGKTYDESGLANPQKSPL